MMKVPDETSGWRKSSYSAQDTDCVEVANTLGAVRDSKNPAGQALAVGALSLVHAVKAGWFDRS